MEIYELDNKLLARYLSGNCSAEEQERVEQWIAQDPENKKKLDEYKRIWKISEKSGLTAKDDFNTLGEWQSLRQRLNKEEISQAEEKSRNLYKKFRGSSIHSASQKFIRIAAVILLASFAGFFTYQNFYQPEPDVQEPVLREISTEKAQRANLTLSDGTKVMLNAESKMKIPKKFASNVREVFLDGQAHFEVVENKKKSFLIHSNQSLIRVLGTSFSVRSYPEDGQVQVAVEKGSVSFESETGKGGSKVVLEKNEIGEFNTNSHEIATRQVQDMELYLSWKEGYLKFQNMQMAKVGKTLERRYNVEVSFGSEEIKNKSLTAYLKSRSIRNVLEVIATSLDIGYQLNDNKVVFLKK